MNLANKITFSRILIIPVLMIFIIPYPEWFPNSDKINEFISFYGRFIAAAIFIIASATDGVDGYIARSRNQITDLGKFLDPIADKLLVTAALISFTARQEISAWIVFVILAREFIITGFRIVAANKGVVIAASQWAKVKTAVQMVAIVFVTLDNYPFSLFTGLPFDDYLMIAALILTILSGVEYLKKNWQVME